MLSLFKNAADEKRQALAVAESITTMGESEGWRHFEKLAENVAASLTPDIVEFDGEDATRIAARMAFVSGIKRCLGLMKQQREILGSLKKPEDN